MDNALKTLDIIRDIVKHIQINDNIIIEVKEGLYPGKYPSRIQDITERGVVINMPAFGGIPFPLEIDSPVEISFVRENGRYAFEGRVIERYKEPFPSLLVSVPQDGFRYNMRRYFRIPVDLPVKIYLTDKDINSNHDKGKENKECEIEASIRCLSGGGVKIITTNKDIKEGDKIYLVFPIDEIKKIFDIAGKVVRKSEIETSPNIKTKYYEIGVEFQDIDRQDRESLIKYTLKKEIERLRA